MMYLTGLVVGFLTVLLAAYHLWNKVTMKPLHDFSKRYKGCKTIPIFGNILDFSSANIIEVLMQYFRKCGDIFPVWRGNHVLIFLAEHDAVESLLSSTRNIFKHSDYRFMKRWLGEGLLTSEPKRWEKVRKILTPAFHFEILQKFTAKFQGPTEILIRKLRRNAGSNSYDIYPSIVLCTLDIICETSMGTKVNAQENENSEYVRAVETITRIIIMRIISFIWSFDFIYMLSKTYREELATLKILHGYTDNVIKERRDELLRRNKEEILDEEENKRISFLDVLLLSSMNGEQLTDLEIREEVDTFMFEGHDTTASGISFTLHCIANHPDVQNKLLEEQKEIFGDYQNSSVTMFDLNKMEYLNQVIKESLRLYPPVPIFGRQTIDDMHVDGTLFPKGHTYYVFAFGLHRNPKYFENPEVFDPMRFAKTNSKKLPYCYVPFSAGSRNCIGQKFAILEMKYVISAVLRNFELTPATPNEEPQLVVEMILKSKNGLKIGLQERKY